jgi:hypothetical protein
MVRSIKSIKKPRESFPWACCHRSSIADYNSFVAKPSGISYRTLPYKRRGFLGAELPPESSRRAVSKVPETLSWSAAAVGTVNYAAVLMPVSLQLQAQVG